MVSPSLSGETIQRVMHLALKGIGFQVAM